MLEILAGMLRTAAPILLAAMGGVVFEKARGVHDRTRGHHALRRVFRRAGRLPDRLPPHGGRLRADGGRGLRAALHLADRAAERQRDDRLDRHQHAGDRRHHLHDEDDLRGRRDGREPAHHRLPRISIPLFDRVPFLDKVLNNHTALVYVSLLLVAALHFLLFHTHLGISLRAVGEKPEAAAAAGIPVYRYRLAASVFAGMLCGLAGVHLSLGYVKMFTENITAGRGFFAYTAVVFGHANPFAAALASFVFGLAEVVTFRVQNLNLPGPLVLTIPYLVTLAVLILRNLRLKKPAAHKPNPAATNN